jgi:putative ABC transport system permease protein
MFRNYFLAAVRNLARYKQYALINVGGMVLGITCAILAIIFANFEMSYDNWITDSGRVYRLDGYYHFPGGADSSVATAGGPTAEAFKNYFSEVEEVTRGLPFFGAPVRVGEVTFQENFTFVDANYLDFFDLEMSLGDRATALDDMNSVIISEAMALKHFGGDDPIGQLMTFSGTKDLYVSGVFRDIPDNSHLLLEFITLFDDALISELFGSDTYTRQWNGVAFMTYARFFEGTNPEAVSERLEAFTNANYRHANPARKDMTPSIFVHFKLMPIQDIHLTSPHQNELKPTGSMGTVIGALAVAALILTIAVINYISLSTATSTLRAREIGMRKVMGAKNGTIRVQFMSEALLVGLIASFLAIVLVKALLPYVADFLEIGKAGISLTSDPWVLALSLAIGPLTGLVSGVYPAFYLARIRPARGLGSSRSEGRGTSWIRSLLVTLQFSISIGLLIAVAVIAQQTRFVSDMDIGVIRENVSVVRIPTLAAVEAVPTLVEELRALPGVISVSPSSSVPTDGQPFSTSVEIPGRDGEDAISAYWASVEPEFFKTYGVKKVAGRLISEEFGEDRLIDPDSATTALVANVVINEKAVKFLGHNTPEEALGSQFRMRVTAAGQATALVTVVGVVADFQYGSAYERVRPTFFLNQPDAFFSISIRASQSAAAGIQEAAKEIWLRRLPDEPFQMQIIDELVESQYVSIGRQRSSLFVLTGLAIAIACLGLFGMATFSVQQRTKEIGIRKVLGAEVLDVVRLLVFQLSGPVIIANLLAWPVSFYLMRNWLEGFVYRIDLTVLPFIAAALAVLVVAWATVVGHTLRVARTNPVHALRYE